MNKRIEHLFNEAGFHKLWTGSTFWFETEQAAVLFALRWS